MTDNPRDAVIDFNDGRAYEHFMGRWSRAVGGPFLDWVAPPRDARWLEVGCGTGALTGLVLRRCAPGRLIATDPAAKQIEIAKCQLGGLNIDRVEFRVASAHLMPFPDDSFDVVAAGLVLNFIPDRKQALAEMRRVGRSSATVAAYVWDFASGRAPNSCLALGLKRIGVDAPSIPGAAGSTLGSLESSFDAAEFENVAVAAFDVTVRFRDFDEFWQSQTPSFSPLSRIIAALPPRERQSVVAFVRSETCGRNGMISHSARANAIKALVP